MYSLIVTPKFSDIDGLGHVNNTVMPEWFELARNPIYRMFNPDFDFKYWNLILARFEVDFTSQIFFHDNVEIQTWIQKIGNSSFEVYQEASQGGIVGAKGKTVLIYYDFKLQKSIPISEPIRGMLNEHLSVIEKTLSCF
ncbi:MAG TPA: thioesterase family protein [Prolixibacteraceae bacterium]|nr:thioesterase family protein [Prolixibacteraceae bacterium]